MVVPIVDVELIGEADGDPEITQRLADAIGEALSSRAGGTWVRVRLLASANYAENGGRYEALRPTFVTVLERTRPTGSDLTDRVSRVTAAVVAVTGCDPNNVHVLFEAAAAGRLAFGGRVVE
jgi:phenylpyruvate tautomerase PptA (4-oxalocrotonate tautomerase family)